MYPISPSTQCCAGVQAVVLASTVLFTAGQKTEICTAQMGKVPPS